MGLPLDFTIAHRPSGPRELPGQSPVDMNCCSPVMALLHASPHATFLAAYLCSTILWNLGCPTHCLCNTVGKGKLSSQQRIQLCLPDPIELNSLSLALFCFTNTSTTTIITAFTCCIIGAIAC